MNNRQKRLCRALLDFYDASGAQPCPLAQLARKTGYDASDIYDKDSQSGDLWPFDPKARGNLAGMLSFASGKNPTVSITTAGLVGLENLLKEEPSAPAPKKTSDAREEKPADVPKAAPLPSKPVVSASSRFTLEDISEARSRFKYWLKSHPAGQTMLDESEGYELIEAAFDKFFSEFLESKVP